ncbi:hypothetical protein [Pseudaminobacter soli (ex Li et al. 2025)]|uniref:hypothetical protein n=1 Tax=Pseudaminobacter soli (ex Li et al. 2025) TaxID=1295366 RepID=UPI0011B23FC8|nr:hypothetical protein [Mesorhizobium soli]
MTRQIAASLNEMAGKYARAPGFSISRSGGAAELASKLSNLFAENDFSIPSGRGRVATGMKQAETKVGDTCPACL